MHFGDIYNVKPTNGPCKTDVTKSKCHQMVHMVHLLYVVNKWLKYVAGYPVIKSHPI